MKRGFLDDMKIIEAKRIKALKSRSIYYRDFVLFNKHRQPENEKPSIKVFLQKLNDNCSESKNAIIKGALDHFLKNKSPINLSYAKYLKNFHKFNISSLVCATTYLNNSDMVSKGDIKTFIYVYFAFNILATKYLDDYSVWNTSYISLWGISYSQAIQLEVLALKSLDYKLDIKMNQIEEVVDTVFSIK